MKLRQDGTLDRTLVGDSGSANGAVVVSATTSDDNVYDQAFAPDGDILMNAISSGANPQVWMIRFDGGAFLDYDDDDAGADNNWTEGDGFFGVCLASFTGPSPDPYWTLDPACTPDETGDVWRPVRADDRNEDLVGNIWAAGTGSADFRFGIRVPYDQRAGTYVAPITMELLAPGIG